MYLNLVKKSHLMNAGISIIKFYGTTANVVVQPPSWRGTSAEWSEEGRTWVRRREMQGCRSQGREWNRVENSFDLAASPGSRLRILPTTSKGTCREDDP